MAEKVNKGWLKDTENTKFAPKTLATNIFIEDGTPFVLEDGRTVARAVKLATPHNIQIDLSSTEATAFDGSEDITPGVMNILGITNGGTGNDLGLIQSGKHESAELGERATAEGIDTFALGDYSHAEGYTTLSGGACSHSEGLGSQAYGTYSHSENYGTIAYGTYSHAEGHSTSTGYKDVDIGRCAHAEGYQVNAVGDFSHGEGVSSNKLPEGFMSIDDTGKIDLWIEEKNFSAAIGESSHIEGSNNLAMSECSHVEGAKNLVTGMKAHAEGESNSAIGGHSHVEGLQNSAIGNCSHAEGFNAIANELVSHAEGAFTQANGGGSHAEGERSTADGYCSHAEGGGYLEGDKIISFTMGDVVLFGPKAAGINSHAEGTQTYALGKSSHSEGFRTKTGGENSHSEGNQTITAGNNSHAEGQATQSNGLNSHAEGELTQANNTNAHAEGKNTIAEGLQGHAEGESTNAKGANSHAEGESTTAEANGSHAEGYTTIASGSYAHAEGSSTQAKGDSSHAEGSETIANNAYSHAEGYRSEANAAYSHAEGYENETLGDCAHAEGYQTKAKGRASHSEGELTTATGDQSHAEGLLSQAAGIASHAEGASFANGDYSHAEGYSTLSGGVCSHASGWGTIAAGNHQTVVGAHNIPDYNSYKIKLYFSSSHGYSLEQLQSGNNRWYDNIHNLPWRVLEFIDGTNVLMGQGEGNNIKENFDINSISSFVSDNNQMTLQNFTCEWDNIAVNNAGNYAFIVGNSLDSNKKSNAMVVGWDGRTRITNDLIINLPALEDGTHTIEEEDVIGKAVLFSSNDATTNDRKKRLGLIQTLVYKENQVSDFGSQTDVDTSLKRVRTHIAAYRPTMDDNCYASIYVDIDSNGNAVAGVGAINNKNETDTPDRVNDIVFYGAAWNDYAEFRNQKDNIEPGYCVASNDNGQVYKTTKKYQACDGIVSDTFGFAIGKTEINKTPLAVAGRVLAYCGEERSTYHAGDTVCAGPEGKVYKMTREEVREYPDRIIGTVSEIPTYEIWNNKVQVNDRIWIKIK